MSKRSLIILSSIFSILFIMIIIFFLVSKYDSNQLKDESFETEQINEINKIGDSDKISTSSEEEIVSPNAKIVLTQFYEKCGHTVEEEYNVPEDIVNMTKDEITNYYSDWTVIDFSNDKVTIQRTNNEICNEHYIVKDLYGYITVYRFNEENEEILTQRTEILTKYLPSDDREKLEKGVVIIGKKDLNIFLEDFE